jgi:3-oxoadipate enol-lactonase
MWGEELLGGLEDGFDIVAYDHRGIGRGDRAEGPFSTADLADDAAAVIASAGWQAANVVGISLGGMVAQELALRHPQMVSSLTIGASTAGGPEGLISETSRRMVEALATRDVEHSTRTSFEANLSRRFAEEVPGAFELYCSRSLAVKVPVPVILFQWEAALAHDAADRVGGITAPTQILHGTADAGIPVVNAHQLSRLMPNARLELFDGAGHLFWWEDPERAVKVIAAHTR